MENGGGIVVTGTVNGNVICTTTGSYRLAKLHRPWRGMPRPDNVTSLLTWKSRIPQHLYGRDEEMAELLRWAQEDYPIGVRLLYGGAGVGKTRLAFEFAEQLASLPGWQCGQLIQPDELIAYPLGTAGTLLIIDYPDEKEAMVRTFFDCLSNMDEPQQIRLRILLLSRRETAKKLYERVKGDSAEPLGLIPLPEDENEQAWHLFADGWREIRHLKRLNNENIPLSRTTFLHWLTSHTLHRSPLFILAFALHQTDQPQDTKLRGPNIIREIVDRESNRITREAEARGIDPKAMRLLKALAGVAGSLGKSAVDYLRMQAHDDLDIPPLPTLVSTSDWSDHALQPMQPDLLAAQLLEDVMRVDHLNASHWLRQCLSLGDAQARADAISRLGRLRFDYLHVLQDSNPAAPTSSTDPLIGELALAARSDLTFCRNLGPALAKDYLERPLLPLSIAIYETLKDRAQKPQEQAEQLNNLSLNLAESGDYSGSLLTNRQAVEIYDRLAVDNFTAYGSHLAHSLTNLSIRLTESNQYASGLDTIRRAVDIFEKLAADNFSAYGADLAGSLGIFSDLLAKQDNHIGALEAVRRAVEISHSLATPGTNYEAWCDVVKLQLAKTEAHKASEQ